MGPTEVVVFPLTMKRPSLVTHLATLKSVSNGSWFVGCSVGRIEVAHESLPQSQTDFVRARLLGQADSSEDPGTERGTPKLTSVDQPLLSFFSRPARIEATPRPYENSREKYLKKSMSLISYD
jgi:hypothetical protein